MSAFSLPTQRCFQVCVSRRSQCSLFSAYAEVFPCCARDRLSLRTFLCLRRGVSTIGKRREDFTDFSLPTQRCFLCSSGKRAYRGCFSLPTQRCFLSPIAIKGWAAAFLCLRRGVSRTFSERTLVISFSLPTQRCFPGTAAIALTARTFLCLRRGVSYAESGK